MMFWFRKNKRQKITQEYTDNLAEKVSQEIQKHKAIKREASKNVAQATGNLNKRIAQNGFTMNIHAAAGGRH